MDRRHTDRVRARHKKTGLTRRRRRVCVWSSLAGQVCRRRRRRRHQLLLMQLASHDSPAQLMPGWRGVNAARMWRRGKLGTFLSQWLVTVGTRHTQQSLGPPTVKSLNLSTQIIISCLKVISAICFHECSVTWQTLALWAGHVILLFSISHLWSYQIRLPRNVTWLAAAIK